MKTLIHPLTLAMMSTLMACASSPPPVHPEATTTSQAPEGQACPLFAARMCDSLDARSEACASVRRVSQWLSESTCQAALADVEQTLSRVSALRKDCLTVGERLCGKAGDAKVCELLNADLSMVPPEDCSKLLQAYPQVEEAFLAKLKSEAPLSAEQQAALVAGDPASFGPEDAKVAVVVFSDFQCPYCAMAANTLSQIRENYGGRVRLIFRHFPLPFHEQARPAAIAARAAQAQGKFWEYHDLLFAHQDDLSEPQLLVYAKQAGVKPVAFEKAVQDSATSTAIDADVALAEQVAVSGTPTMFLNGVRVENPTDFEAVSAALDEALENAVAQPPAGDAAAAPAAAAPAAATPPAVKAAPAAAQPK